MIHESTPKLIAPATAISLAGREVIEMTDRDSLELMGETIDALHEHLAVAGGVLLLLAEWLGVSDEVDQFLAEGQARLTVFRTLSGMAGRA